MSKLKQKEKEITEMVENFDARDFKKNALKELNAIETKTKKSTAYIRHIVLGYPDFNSIEFRITRPDIFVAKININVEALKGNKKAIRNAAKLVLKWYNPKEVKK